MNYIKIAQVRLNLDKIHRIEPTYQYDNGMIVASIQVVYDNKTEVIQLSKNGIIIIANSESNAMKEAEGYIELGFNELEG